MRTPIAHSNPTSLVTLAADGRGRGIEAAGLSPGTRPTGFTAGMRRSEVSALHWSDVVDATAGDGVLVRVRIVGLVESRYAASGTARAVPEAARRTNKVSTGGTTSIAPCRSGVPGEAQDPRPEP